MVVKLDRSDSGEMQVGLGPIKVTLSGKLAKQALVVMVAGGGFWLMNKTLQEIKIEVIKTNIEVQAIIEAMPESQQRAAKKNIADRMQVLRMAEAVGVK